MRNDVRFSAAGRSYATAHQAHYESKDLRQALGLYEDIMAAHPDTQEAGYSRSQIQNIVKAVVPTNELFTTHVALALSHLASVEKAQVAEVPAESISSGSPR